MSGSIELIYTSDDSEGTWNPTGATGSKSGLCGSADGTESVTFADRRDPFVHGCGCELDHRERSKLIMASRCAISRRLQTRGSRCRRLNLHFAQPGNALVNNNCSKSELELLRLVERRLANGGSGEWWRHYTWQTAPTPALNITPASGDLLISWIVPPMPFVLQENIDLNATDWTDVTTQPTLNLTNLHHEVSMPLSSSNRLYRLKSL